MYSRWATLISAGTQEWMDFSVHSCIYPGSGRRQNCNSIGNGQLQLIIMKKVKPKIDAKTKLTLDMRPLERTIRRFSETTQNIISFEVYFLAVELLIIVASMDFPSTWQADHFRIYVYSTVMLALGFLKRFKMDYSNLDPLGISKWAWLINFIDIALQINAFYLLIRLVADIPLTNSAVVVIHCVYSTYTHIESSKRIPKFKYRSMKPSRMKIAQPLIMFVFCKTISTEFNEVAFVFLIFSYINIVVFLEMGNALFFKNFILNFWYKRLLQIQENKKSSIRTRKLILKNLLVLIALLITIQNLLAVFEKLRYEISIALLQSLMVGGYGYYMYTNLQKPQTKFRIQK